MSPHPFTATPEGVNLVVRVTPNARTSAIEGVHQRDDGKLVLAIKVREVPDKGRANKAVIALLAKTLDLPKSRISVTRGHTARLKTLSIMGDSAPLSAQIAALFPQNS